MEKWYKSSFRRNLVDMHIPDWDDDFLSKFDSKAYVANLKYANVDTAYIYATSSMGVCNWPTKIGHMHKAFQGRDVIAELIDECHKNGIRPILYVNFWSRYAFDEHEDWRAISPEGKDSMEYLWLKNRFGVCCCNSPYTDYFLSLVEELLSMYDTEALWVDMALWSTVCTCGHCSARFKKETGFELPKIVDWDKEVWPLFINKRIEWQNGLLADIERSVKKQNPVIDMLYNSVRYNCWGAGVSLEGYNFSEFTTGDFTADRPFHSFYCKFANATSKNHPPEFLCPISSELEYHSVFKTVEQLKVLLFSCYLNNLRFGFIDAIDPIGTFNNTVYERMREVYLHAMPYEKYLDSEVEFINDVALYITVIPEADENENGHATYVRPTHTPHMWASKQFSAFLRDNHIPYTLITKKDLKNLGRYKAILLSDASVLSDVEIDAFTEYVNAGGKMYISGAAGLYDQTYQKTDGQLKALTGVELVGFESHKELYIGPVKSGDDRFLYFTPEHPLACGEQRAAKTKLLGKAQMVASFIYPYSHAGCAKFSSGISNPPWFKSDNPAVVSNTYGKGKVMYSAYPLELLKTIDERKVLLNLLREILPENPAFSTDAPACVEITAYTKSNSDVVLNILNDQMAESNILICEFTVKLKSQIPPIEIIDAATENKVAFEYSGGYVNIQIKKLEIFKMLVIKTK